jgi:hypothetical protein
LPSLHGSKLVFFCQRPPMWHFLLPSTSAYTELCGLHPLPQAPLVRSRLRVGELFMSYRSCLMLVPHVPTSIALDVALPSPSWWRVSCPLFLALTPPKATCWLLLRISASRRGCFATWW